jgi:hypothetical protein
MDRVLPNSRSYARRRLAVALLALIVASGRLIAQPRRPLPTLRQMEVVPLGALLPPPSSSPRTWVLRAGVVVDREQWRTSVREGIAGTITVERLRSGLVQLRIAPTSGGAPVLVAARLPIDTSELAHFLGAPAPGLYREIAQPNRGGQCLRLQVSTDRARLEIVQAEGASPASLRFDGVELVQQPEGRAFAAPSSGWNYPVPAAVRVATSRAELWQGQAVVLVSSQGQLLLAAVTTSTVAKPRGAARHLLDGDSYILGAVLLFAR